jgi:hypothetical protein
MNTYNSRNATIGASWKRHVSDRPSSTPIASARPNGIARRSITRARSSVAISRMNTVGPSDRPLSHATLGTVVLAKISACECQKNPK